MTAGTVGAALRAAGGALDAARIDAVREGEIGGGVGDARRLMAAALGCAPDRVLLRGAEPLPDDAAAQFERFVDERLRHRPVAQIVGGRWFRGHWFTVTGDVLDPRPETEGLVDLALERLFASVLDLGTGSGCILLSLLAAQGKATGTGTDLSPKALAVARGNAARLGVADRARWRAADWFGGLVGAFDLIVSNPPYIAAAEMPGLAPDVRDWEPHLALTDGGDGLAAYRAIAAGLPRHLAPGGRVLLEIGPTQGAAVTALLSGAGLSDVRVHPDLAGRDRIVSARHPAPG